MQSIYQYKRIAAGYLEDHLILHTLLRYFFHLTILLVFIIATANLYVVYEKYLLLHLSTITYSDTKDQGGNIIIHVVVFMVICYVSAYRSLHKNKLSEYYLPLVLLENVLWLTAAIFIEIVYDDLVNKRGSIINKDLKDGFILAIFINLSQNLLMERYLKKCNSPGGIRI
ncbi:MAG TPA: hypothetical protein VNX40_15085 [Mucilaginibacter sp.]|nr:hypothetical protein [Mucilaginibacter sp.]